jgi:hypothetical protein
VPENYTQEFYMNKFFFNFPLWIELALYLWSQSQKITVIHTFWKSSLHLSLSDWLSYLSY